MNQQKVLILVESPTKAVTISAYLENQQSDYTVLATQGHVRQLPKIKNAVRPEENFAMYWVKNKKNMLQLKQIINAAKALDSSTDLILLASDFDREGNAIAYHLQQILQNEYNIKTPIKRIIFKEITKASIINAIQNHCDLDIKSVNSYFARSALDYLVGFNLSPILWIKLKRCKSAGRVQSAGLRAIIDRDAEILEFESKEYWTLDSQFNISDMIYDGTLTQAYNVKSTSKLTKDEANQLYEQLINEVYHITSVDFKNGLTSPKNPFTTSTLQQTTSQEFSWTGSKTMKVAQSLYEGININNSRTGLITYMRTDSTRISENALSDICSYIKAKYGSDYIKRRQYTVKNAQDAHEGIRPTNIKFTPNDIANFLTSDQNKLYKLIWERTLASQMSDIKFTTILIKVNSDNSIWTTSKQHTTFDGFAILFPDKISHNPGIYKIKTDTSIVLEKLRPVQHFTKSKGHFNEASFIKYLDTAGIGRPSTYASIVDTLEDRGYITRDKQKIIATPKGWIVIGFLNEFSSKYIQDDFTSILENKLDMIASGDELWKNVVEEFWREFQEVIKLGNEMHPKAIYQTILDKYSTYFLGKDNSNKCNQCADGKKVLCITNKSEFLGCSNYPACTWIQNVINLDKKHIGDDTETNESILIKKGMYGYYLNWPVSKKNIGLSENLIKLITLDIAIELKNLPKVLGKHPITKQDVKVNIGRYGTYVEHDQYYASFEISKIQTINLQDALELLGHVGKKRTTQNKSNLLKQKVV